MSEKTDNKKEKKNKGMDFMSVKELRAISKRNRRTTNLLEKKRSRKNVPESEYLCKMRDPKNVVEFDDLHTYFFTDVGTVKAVDGVTYDVPQGKIVGVVGESGCGKSISSLSLMQLVQRPQGQIVEGSIRLNLGDKAYDVAKTPTHIMQHIRGRVVSMIFQEPMTSLNPIFRIGRQLDEVILLHGKEKPNRIAGRIKSGATIFSIISALLLLFSVFMGWFGIKNLTDVRNPFKYGLFRLLGSLGTGPDAAARTIENIGLDPSGQTTVSILKLGLSGSFRAIGIAAIILFLVSALALVFALLSTQSKAIKSKISTLAGIIGSGGVTLSSLAFILNVSSLSGDLSSTGTGAIFALVGGLILLIVLLLKSNISAIVKDDPVLTAAKARSIEMLELVGIANAEGVYNMFPHELSGGMRQRAMIAMALACDPRLIIADEPTTALDVTIQAQILEILRNLKDKINSSIMLITHDLGVIAEMADYVVVMYAGRIVEKGTSEEVFLHPAHPYTVGLMASKPIVNKVVDRLYSIPGSVPNPINMPDHCYFKDRCEKTCGKCTGKYPGEVRLSNTHIVSCYLYEGQGGGNK